MPAAIYAGSFDPWSYGHQYVLSASREIFEEIHIVAAVNPIKQGTLSPEARGRAIAHAIDPYVDWWKLQPPFRLGRGVLVVPYTGLVVDYAREHNIRHLIRGLRSTSDFEAEFNLYFSNYAIEESVQTWCVMCPPWLLHCSSTFVRSTVGCANVDFVGTTFLIQCILLDRPRALGRILDVIVALSKHRFEHQRADLSQRELNSALQSVFVSLIESDSGVNLEYENVATFHLNRFLDTNRDRVCADVERGGYPEDDVHTLWAILTHSLAETTSTPGSYDIMCASWLARLESTLGKAAIPLFDVIRVKVLLGEMAQS